MNDRRMSCILLVALVGAIPTEVCAQGTYTASFVDGTVVENERLSDWTSAATAKVGNRRLFDDANPARTLRNVALPVVRPPESFVELVNGDRLPGTVVGYRSGAESPFQGQPACVLVKPHGGVLHGRTDKNDLLRVNASWVRRIVWRGSAAGRQSPATLTLRSGENLPFANLRWTDRGLEVHSQGEIKAFPLADLAELHLPADDPWQAHFRQIAVLSPRLKARLIELETADGLRVTASTDRLSFVRLARVTFEHKSHLVQPVWSLDSFSVALDRIRQWRFFAPTETPLSAIAPSKCRQQSLSGGGWAWQTDRALRGGPLTGDGKSFAWGFGVLAHTELTFPLPAAARSFRTRIALDDGVGKGGCARAKIFAEAATGKPLFESRLLVGSGKIVDTGAIALNGKATHLVLVADTADGQGPPDADPLDIRGMMNWLEPIVELDADALKSEVERCLLDRIAAWQGWEVVEPLSTVRLVNSLSLISPTEKGYVEQVIPEGPALTLRRRLRVPAGKSWLAFNVTRPLVTGKVESKLVVRVGVEKYTFDVPARRAMAPPNPEAIPLHTHAGQDVDIEIAYRPKGDRALHWHSIDVVDTDPVETLRPPPPEKFELTDAKSYRVGLKWDGPKKADGVHGFRITRGFAKDFNTATSAPVGTIGVAAQEFSDAKPVEGKTAWYAVEAVDEYGRRSLPRYLQVDVPANAPPTNDLALLPFPVENGIVLTWHGPLEEDVASVNLYRRPEAGGALQKVKTFLPKNKVKHVDTYFDANLPAGKYLYVLKAKDRSGLESVGREVSTMTSKLIRRVNSGGVEITAPPGVNWAGDVGNSAQSSFFVSALPIAKAGLLEPIYQSERWSYNLFSYRFDVPPGRYRVVVHLAETSPHYFKAGARKFNVEVDGVAIHREVDIAKQAGPQTALQLIGDVTATKNSIAVTFAKVTGGPSVRGLEIYAIPD